jgi:hypothetical protein
MMPPPNEGDSLVQLVPDEVLYEVVDNQIRELPPMSVREIHLASTLMRILSSFAWTGGLGHVESEMLFLLRTAKNPQRRPDLAYICLPSIALAGFIESMPILVSAAPASEQRPQLRQEKGHRV